MPIIMPRPFLRIRRRNSGMVAKFASGIEKRCPETGSGTYELVAGNLPARSAPAGKPSCEGRSSGQALLREALRRASWSFKR